MWNGKIRKKASVTTGVILVEGKGVADLHEQQEERYRRAGAVCHERGDVERRVLRRRKNHHPLLVDACRNLVLGLDLLDSAPDSDTLVVEEVVSCALLVQ